MVGWWEVILSMEQAGRSYCPYIVNTDERMLDPEAIKISHILWPAFSMKTRTSFKVRIQTSVRMRARVQSLGLGEGQGQGQKELG